MSWIWCDLFVLLEPCWPQVETDGSDRCRLTCWDAETPDSLSSKHGGNRMKYEHVIKYVCWLFTLNKEAMEANIKVGKSPSGRLETVEHVGSKDVDFTRSFDAPAHPHACAWGEMCPFAVFRPEGFASSHRAVHALWTVCQSVLISLNKL